MKFEDFLQQREELFHKTFDDVMKDIENRIEKIKVCVLQQLNMNKDIIVITDRSLVLQKGTFGQKCPQFEHIDTLIGQSVEIAIHDWLKDLGYLAFVEWSNDIKIYVYSAALKEKMEQYVKKKDQNNQKNQKNDEFVKVELPNYESV